MSTIRRTAFLNRESELTNFHAIIDSLLHADIQIGSPTIFQYLSIAGTGKTALFQEFKKYGLVQGLQVLEIDFAPKRASNEEARYVLDIILGWFKNDQFQDIEILSGYHKLFETNPKNEFSLEESRIIKQIILRLVEKKTILLIDSAQYCSTKMFEWFSEFIIEPLIEANQARVFIASQSELKWGKLNYRFKRRYLKMLRLSPLSEVVTGEQLESLGINPSFTPEVYRLTTGNARANIDIAHEIANLDHKINSSNFRDFERRLVDTLHKDFIENKAVFIPEEYYRAIQYVSVLRRIDISLPNTFLQYIDASKEWQLFDWHMMLNQIRESTGNLLFPREDRDAGEVWYSIEPLVRKILALKLRFDSPDDYLVLSNAAVEYYDKKFRKELKIKYLIEKLYHLADVERIIYGKWDVGIIKNLMRSFSEDLQLVFAELYRGPTTSDEVAQGFLRMPRNLRVDQMQSLRKLMEEDDELRDKIGDSDEERTVFDDVINSVLTRVESHDKLYLYIVKSPISEKIDKQNKDKYFVSVNLGDLPVLTKKEMEISFLDRESLLNHFQKVKTVKDLKYVGTAMATAILPKDVKIQLMANNSPAVIVVDDESIPWEMMYLENDFLGLKISLGKQILVKRNPSTIIAPSKPKPSLLVVGVSKSLVPEYASRDLPLVREEIKELKSLLSQDTRIDFDPSTDILLDERATSLDFQTSLGLGRYDFIHFAGHAAFGVDDRSKGGLVLYDQIVPYESIAEKLSGSPTILLNACKTAGVESSNAQTLSEYQITLNGARAFLEGGALGCISNIWNIDDKTAAVFSRSFYSNLLNGISVGEALRRSKEKLRIEQPDSLCWLGYILLGQPDLRPFRQVHDS
jgi:hypothetical protein